MKRIISIVLAFVLSINILVTGCYAVNAEYISKMATADLLVDNYLPTKNSSVEHRELLNSVYNDLALLEVAHLDTLVSINNVDSAGHVMYEISYEGNIVDYISVSSNESGDIVLKIQENDIYNELMYSTNGAIYLNGKPAYDVTTTDISTGDDIVGAVDNTTRAGPISTLNAISLPEGADSIPSTFEYYSGTVGTTISLTQSLATIAISTLISIVTSAALGSAITLIGMGSAIVSSILSEALTIATSQINILKAAYPDAKKMSYKMYAYRKIGNNTFHSEFIYLFHLYGNPTCDGTPVFAGAKKVIEST